MNSELAQVKMTDYDIIISGGGLAGMSMAAVLGHYGWHVACLDDRDPTLTTQNNYDIRTTAISYGSRHVLSIAGVWQHLEGQACAINDIHILDGKSPNLLQFLSDEVEGKSFGWIVDNAELRKAMLKTIKASHNISLMAPCRAVSYHPQKDHVRVKTQDGQEITAKLLVGADGRHSAVRESLNIKTQEWAYNQQALVFIVGHENPHHHVAVEHFRKEGPFAILPMVDAENGTHRSSVVWTEHGDQKSYKDFEDESFTAAINHRFPGFYGEVSKIGSVAVWPLRFMQALSYTGQRTALIAEAAHVIHPIAGQGLNMSLRDVAALTEVIHGHADPGQASLLSEYESWRKKDNFSMGLATDTLNRLFSNDVFPVRMLRSVGLELVKHTKPAKQFFMKQAMGHMGSLPKLVRGQDLAS